MNRPATLSEEERRRLVREGEAFATTLLRHSSRAADIRRWIGRAERDIEDARR